MLIQRLRRSGLPLWVKVLPFYVLLVLVFLYPAVKTHIEHSDAKKAAVSAQQKLDQSLVTPAKKTQTIDKVGLIEGQPSKIVIPTSGVDVSIVNGYYFPNANVWSVAPTTANYDVDSAEPNNVANKTYIYGHWTPGVFGPTVNLASGDVAYVYTTNNHIFKYKYVGNNVIDPTNTSVVASLNGTPGLVLMTCQGTWAQYRRLMYFNFVSAV